MTQIAWDTSGERLYETGVDHGVLYPLNSTNGLYDSGVAWNGLTTVTESPAGADANPQFADNIKYLNLLSAETFGATIEALTYPDEFGPCDGTASPEAGVNVGQQPRQTFGLCYRTKVGNDVNAELGYKLHLAYGLLASPSEKAYATVNDSPAAVSFSWAVTSTPVNASGFAPVSLITIDSTQVDEDALTALQSLLFGTVDDPPSLPMPDDVLALFAGTVTEVTPTAPTFASNVITIPTVTGVIYWLDGIVATPGTHTITANKVVHATPAAGYIFSPVSVDEWLFTHS
jgi:hypothetical protein